MKSPIIETLEPLTLIGGGEASPEDLRTARTLAPLCVAADGGAGTALDAGIMPAAVIGDMDSITHDARAQIVPEILHHIAEQNSTDFDKALRNVACPLVIAVGFTGGRADHTLASLHTLVVRCDRPVILLGGEDIVFLCPPQLSLPVPAGTRVSLFPMGRVTGRSTGLKWSLEGIVFEPGVRSGTSNIATGDVKLEVSDPVMLCIMPRGLIQPVAGALVSTAPRGRWPARAE